MITIVSEPLGSHFWGGRVCAVKKLNLQNNGDGNIKEKPRAFCIYDGLTHDDASKFIITRSP